MQCPRCHRETKVYRVYILDGEDYKLCDMCDTALQSQIIRWIRQEVFHLSADPTEA